MLTTLNQLPTTTEPRDIHPSYFFKIGHAQPVQPIMSGERYIACLPSMRWDYPLTVIILVSTGNHELRVQSNHCYLLSSTYRMLMVSYVELFPTIPSEPIKSIVLESTLHPTIRRRVINHRPNPRRDLDYLPNHRYSPWTYRSRMCPLAVLNVGPPIM